MAMHIKTTRSFEKEADMVTSKSSGPGGQHVNKTETKVELRFHVETSKALNTEEKEIIKHKLAKRINNDGFLIVTSQENRSQLMNKESAIGKLNQLINNALKKRKKRIPTKPTNASVIKRITTKKQVSQKKASRGRKSKMDIID